MFRVLQEKYPISNFNQNPLFNSSNHMRISKQVRCCNTLIIHIMHCCILKLIYDTAKLIYDRYPRRKSIFIDDLITQLIKWHTLPAFNMDTPMKKHHFFDKAYLREKWTDFQSEQCFGKVLSWTINGPGIWEIIMRLN